MPLWRLVDGDRCVESYCVEGSMATAGAAVERLVRVGLPARVDDLGVAALRSRDHPLVVPSFAGIGTPHDDPTVRALVAGIGLDSGADDIVAGVVDGIALAREADR
ncbi:MAG: hypothetical protein ACE5GB_05155 [Acidimicrobiales bacterium]